MDIDPDEDNGPDDGAIEDDDDEYDAQAVTSELDDNEPDQRTGRNKHRRGACDSIADDEAQDAATASMLHPDDPGNFLKLCTALKILQSKKIIDAELDESEGLLRGYCLELVRVSMIMLHFQMIFSLLVRFTIAVWPVRYSAKPPLFCTRP
jgi:hypothetical protein